MVYSASSQYSSHLHTRTAKLITHWACWAFMRRYYLASKANTPLQI
ncbi:hypothetical protein PTRA_a3501 [Pseudoalteromonas translucida KMM 520]|uniref:Uncharacterized protein n=1 Tax=Pseudoalteromonas translucida KMM 520 TaxID=1315283 RepID=A0A0U2X377_9GAMM|nr:hypothetical protein PTRA_a3501 [Pseudoalteromonas translucida KMM 520]